MQMRTPFLVLASLLLAAPALADFKLVNRDGRYAEYDGTLTLGGRFERRQDAETLDWRGDRVCFFPEAEAVKKLPRSFPTNKPAMFCFSNSRSAVALLKLPAVPATGFCGFSGTATVTISRYVVENGIGETYDLAMLGQVADVSPLANIACP